MIISAFDADSFIAAVSAMSETDPFACRIASLCLSYAPSLAFVDYWLTADENGAHTGAIARNGSYFILFLTDKSDPDEISSFLRMSGAAGVLCDGKYELDYSASVTSGIVMKTVCAICADEIGSIVEPEIRDAYDLIVKCEDESFTPPAFDDFYVDVNHRLRHKTARLRGLSVDGALAAVAITVAESKNGAVLGAVACLPEFRRRGCGTQLVAQITNELVAEGKTVFLHRAQNANAAFYENMGFVTCGTWREYKL